MFMIVSKNHTCMVSLYKHEYAPKGHALNIMTHC